LPEWLHLSEPEMCGQARSMRPQPLWSKHRVLSDPQWQPHLPLPPQLHPPARHDHRVWQGVREGPRLLLGQHLPELPVRPKTRSLRPNPLRQEHAVQREQAGQPGVHLQRWLRTSSGHDHRLLKDCCANPTSRPMRPQPLWSQHSLRCELRRQPCLQVPLRLRAQPRHDLRMQGEA